MAEGIQDVHIIGVDGSIDVWSREVTQTQIAASMRQATSQNSGMLSLLTAIANDVKPSPAELKTISSLIKSQTQINKATGDKIERTVQTGNTEDAKQATVLKKSMFRSTNSLITQFKKQEQADQKRANLTNTLMKAGMSQSDASQAAAKQVQKDNWAKSAKQLGVMALGLKGVADMFHEAVSTGFKERFDMASQIRQSGLMSGLDSAKQGFISIAKTISDTGFTFGEAAEFTKQFSKAVGVKGVESTLKFAHAMADPSMRNGVGLMERFSMDFGQVANMSGQYLESLRNAGQLRGKTDEQLTKGMNSFMSNVEMTANVMKISLEEAAELMRKSLSPDQAGLMALLPEKQRESVMFAMEGMSVQGQESPVQQALAARLASGSQQAFLQSDEYKGLAQSGIGIEVLQFVNEAAESLEVGGNDVFQDFMATEFPNFAKELTTFASQSAVQIQLVNDKSQAALLGSINAMAETMKSANEEISGGDVEDKTQALAYEQAREGAMLAEKAMNELMPSFITNLDLLTKSNADFARQAAATLMKFEPLISGMINASTSIQRLENWTATQTMDILTPDSIQEDERELVELNRENMDAGIEDEDERKQIMSKYASDVVDGDDEIGFWDQRALNKIKDRIEERAEDFLEKEAKYQKRLMEHRVDFQADEYEVKVETNDGLNSAKQETVERFKMRETELTTDLSEKYQTKNAVNVAIKELSEKMMVTEENIDRRSGDRDLIKLNKKLLEQQELVLKELRKLLID